MGSGTTAVAAKKIKRNFLGIDINNKYCQLAQDRLFQIQPRLFEEYTIYDTGSDDESFRS